MVESVRNILEELGYSEITEHAKELRTRPIYRESTNNTVLSIRKDSGRFIDFAAGITGDLTDLVKLSLKLTKVEDAILWLKDRNIQVSTITSAPKQRISTPKVFDKESLLRLVKDTTYWEGRNIKPEVVSRFEGGLAYKGKMAGRYVFPVYNHRQDIVGFAGRDIFNNSERTKWKLLGSKEEWVYPAFLNSKAIKRDRSVILVESIGDCLALFNAGIENVLVMFGVSLGTGILNFLIRADVDCVLVSPNNDQVEGKNCGNEAAQKIYYKLLRHFDQSQVEIALPDKKDFGVMSREEILLWKNKRHCPPVVSNP